MSEEAARPSPDALLEQTGESGRGRLRIFLGAAPGVGKTYEMLSQARRRNLQTGDVVIGVVETHGRMETDALTKGFDIIPKKRVLYKGRVLAENTALAHRYHVKHFPTMLLLRADGTEVERMEYKSETATQVRRTLQVAVEVAAKGAAGAAAQKSAAR